MLSLKEFVKIFENKKPHIPLLRLVNFYLSIRKCFILERFGNVTYPKIRELSDKYQWPVLEKLADQNLEVYNVYPKGMLDKGLLKIFINGIEDEISIRARRKKISKDDFYRYQKVLIYDRIGCFKSIFGCTKEDLEYFESVAGRYRGSVSKKAEKGKLWRKIGLVTVGIGAASIIAGAAVLYEKVTEKKEDKK
ncbi:MAG: hypothetical protein WCX17_04065 [Parcubacteria group bacterium]